MAAYFVTGTDTGVGKTLVAAALLDAFVRSGRRCVGMKPVAAGRENGRWADREALVAAGNVAAPEGLVNPYAFEPPIAPHIAAAQARVEISIDRIGKAFDALRTRAEVVVVEGAGGFMIPLNERETSADLARALGVPAILVVGMRLGCLNHALLTRAAMVAAGVRCAAWVANEITPGMPFLEENVRSLQARLGCPLLARIPYRPGLAPGDAARWLNLDVLND